MQTDLAAIEFARAMRRRAIAHFQACDQRTLDAIRRDPSVTHGRPDSASVQERLEVRTLTCHAKYGSVNGVPTYRTWFTLDGTPISVCDAEGALMGFDPEVTLRFTA